ncbi:MAG: peptide deformylase [Bradymonadia bacterium]
MSVREILTIGDPLLRMPARRLRSKELRRKDTQALIDDLVETMHHANGAGLAAPQVGWPVQIAAVHVQDNPRYPYKPNIPLTVFVNPVIHLRGEDTALINEGCLSVPGWRGEVPRYMQITVEALDRDGNPIKFDVNGLSAATYQHEFDHLQGRLFVDRVMDPTSFMTWAQFERVHRRRFEHRARALVERYGQ